MIFQFFFERVIVFLKIFHIFFFISFLFFLPTYFLLYFIFSINFIQFLYFASGAQAVFHKNLQKLCCSKAEGLACFFSFLMRDYTKNRRFYFLSFSYFLFLIKSLFPKKGYEPGENRDGAT